LNHKVVVGLYLTILSMAIFNTVTIPVRAKENVKPINIGIYWNRKCTKSIKYIDWGALEPESSVIKVIYIKNKSKIPLALHIYYSDINPLEAEKYIILDWDKEGYTLDARSVIQATVTLSIPHSVSNITDFYFNVVIEGTG